MSQWLWHMWPSCRVWFGQCCILITWCVIQTILWQATEQRSPPQVNDVLTPRACQALLAYTLTLGEPVRCIPLFCNACIVGQVSYRSLYHRSCVGFVTGIFYLIGLVQIYFCTLLPPGLVWVYHHTLLPSINSSWWLASAEAWPGLRSDTH